MDPTRLDGRHARAAWETDLEWALTTPDNFFADRLDYLEAGTYSVVSTEQEAKEAAVALRSGCLEQAKIAERTESRGISWDVETRGKMYDDDFVIISVALAVRGSNAAYVWDRPSCEDPIVRQPLLDLLADPKLLFIEQGSYDENASLCYFKTGIAGQRRDTRLLRKMLDSDVRKAGLDTLSELVGMGGYKDEFETEKAAVRDRVKKWKPRQLLLFDDCPDPYARQRLWEIYTSKNDKLIEDYEGSYLYALTPRDKTTMYNARDTITTGFLDELLWPQVQADEGLATLWAEVTGPASRSYGRSEHWGVPMSRTALEALIYQADRGKESLVPQLNAHLSDQFRGKVEWGSRDQVARFFYTPKEHGGLGLPVPKKTKGDKDALDKDVMEVLAPLHPCAAIYQAFSALDVPREKAEEFLRYLRRDGCVHPSYLLDGTRTGRPSCTSPNMYSIQTPEDCDSCHGKGCEACDGYGTDPESRRIRTCIEAPEEYEFVEVDLSQIEMRGMAVFCNEPVLIDAYIARRDIHQETIDFVLQRTGKHIPRRQAKVGNFMIPYGGTDFSFAARLKIPEDEGKIIFGSIESRYPAVNAAKRRMLAEARRTGYSYNIWRGKMAQKRPLWDLDSREGYKRRKAENACFNTPIQGTYSGSLTLASHARLVDYVLREELDHLWRPVYCTYDSISALMHRSIVPFATRMTADVMTDWEIGRLEDGSRFPLEADAKRGRNLGLAKKYKPPETLAAALAESKKLGLLEARRDPRRGRMGLLTA
jgi:DNA polymerase I-like protein with 3'-5' exonuclease and polymerase domains